MNHWQDSVVPDRLFVSRCAAGKLENCFLAKTYLKHIWQQVYQWLLLVNISWHGPYYQFVCSSFIRQSTKHIKWSSKVVHGNNIICAYNHTTFFYKELRCISSIMYTCPGCLNFLQSISCIAPLAILPLVYKHGIVPVSVKETRMTSSFINTWKHTVSLTQNEDIYEHPVECIVGMAVENRLP